MMRRTGFVLAVTLVACSGGSPAASSSGASSGSGTGGGVTTGSSGTSGSGASSSSSGGSGSSGATCYYPTRPDGFAISSVSASDFSGSSVNVLLGDVSVGVCQGGDTNVPDSMSFAIPWDGGALPSGRFDASELSASYTKAAPGPAGGDAYDHYVATSGWVEVSFEDAGANLLHGTGTFALHFEGSCGAFDFDAGFATTCP